MHTNEGICMSQCKYTEGLLKRFKMKECKVLKTPMEQGQRVDLCGDEEDAILLFIDRGCSLLYLCFTRSNIQYVASYLSPIYG